MYNIVLKVIKLIYAQRAHGYFDAQNSSTKFKDNPAAKVVQEQKVAIGQATVHSSDNKFQVWLIWQTLQITSVRDVWFIWREFIYIYVDIFVLTEMIKKSPKANVRREPVHVNTENVKWTQTQVNVYMHARVYSRVRANAPWRVWCIFLSVDKRTDKRDAVALIKIRCGSNDHRLSGLFWSYPSRIREAAARLVGLT